jgi:ADP-ribose pyrophosphatase YjhB (NUDIX family)
MSTHDLEIELIARGLCRRDDRVLLCKSIKNKYLYLPGGHIEFGETAADALDREFMEETGQLVSVGDLALIHEHFFRQGPHLHHELNLVFHVEHVPEKVTSREKKIGFEWVALSDLPDLDVRPEFHRKWLLQAPPPGGPPQWTSEPFD